MNTVRLCLARHGETDWNAEGRIQGQLDVPLNARGRVQALALARHLAGHDWAGVWSSDLARARETAAPLVDRLDQPLIVSEQWRERHHGRMQGRTYQELAREWPEGYRRLRAREPGFDVEGGESLLDLRARCAANLAGLAARFGSGKVLVITHGGVIDAIYRLVSGQALEEPRRVPIRNAAVHWLQHAAGTWSIERWGVEDHLDAARDELAG